MKSMLTGVGVALVTPFNSKGEVDYKSLEKLVEFQINNGTDYLVVLGTTGESVTLSREEKQDVLNCVLRVNDKRLPVVLGIGGNNTRELVTQLKNTDFSGVEAILSVSPYYNKPTQEGIYQHYRLFAESAPRPVILYNVPGRTSSNITADTTLRLARDFKNIVAVKEASGNLEQIMAIVKDKPEDFKVISGDDALTLPIIAGGGEGVISVIANALPNEFSFMVHQALEGNFTQARTAHFELLDMMGLIFREGNPGGIKALLAQRGICEEHLRLPLWPVSEETRNMIARAAKKFKAPQPVQTSS